MKLSYFFAVIVFAASAISVQAQTNTAPINTVPEGITTFQIPGTGLAQTSVSYFSAPLSNDPVYTGAVSALSTVTASTTDTVAVGDSPAPWTAGQFSTAAAPYFLKFLSGLEAGRVMLIKSNTTSTLTLDTTDGTLSRTVALDATNFVVAPGDTFEVFAGDTLGLMFGTTSANLVLIGGARGAADTINVFDRSAGAFDAYYFSTSLGFWVPSTGTVNSNNVIIYPYSAFFITRQQQHAASSFVLTGRVAEVSHLVQTNGRAAVFDSTGYPVDVALSHLALGTSWAVAPHTFPTSANADTISVWDASAKRFDTYFELDNGQWRLQGDASSSDKSTFVIPAGTTVSFLKRASVSGAASFVIPGLPYSLTQ